MNNTDRNGNILVSYEVAELLKLCDFNLYVYNFYNSNGLLCEAGGSAYDWNSETGDYQDTSAPSQSLAQKWLREVKGVDICVYHNYLGLGSFTTGYHVQYVVKGDIHIFWDGYNGYEHALEAGLKECLTKLYNGEI